MKCLLLCCMRFSTSTVIADSVACMCMQASHGALVRTYHHLREAPGDDMRQGSQAGPTAPVPDLQQASPAPAPSGQPGGQQLDLTQVQAAMAAANRHTRQPSQREGPGPGQEGAADEDSDTEAERVQASRRAALEGLDEVRKRWGLGKQESAREVDMMHDAWVDMMHDA